MFGTEKGGKKLVIASCVVLGVSDGCACAKQHNIVKLSRSILRKCIIILHVHYWVLFFFFHFFDFYVFLFVNLEIEVLY